MTNSTARFVPAMLMSSSNLCQTLSVIQTLRLTPIRMLGLTRSATYPITTSPSFLLTHYPVRTTYCTIIVAIVIVTNTNNIIIIIILITIIITIIITVMQGLLAAEGEGDRGLDKYLTHTGEFFHTGEKYLHSYR